MPPHIRGVLNPFLPHPTAPALTHLRCGLRYAAHMRGLKYPLAYARMQEAGSLCPLNYSTNNVSSSQRPQGPSSL